MGASVNYVCAKRNRQKRIADYTLMAHLRSATDKGIAFKRNQTDAIYYRRLVLQRMVDSRALMLFSDPCSRFTTVRLRIIV